MSIFSPSGFLKACSIRFLKNKIRDMYSEDTIDNLFSIYTPSEKRYIYERICPRLLVQNSSLSKGI